MIRLTAGQFRGRLLSTPPGFKTRPTQARLRQALFNSLQAEVPDAKVLDLFAGSGALGLEALSRGAGEVVFVDQNRAAIQVIEKNCAALKVQSQCTLLQESVDKVIPKLTGHCPFRLVLADPPYHHGWELRLLNTLPWDLLLEEGGYFCIEWGFHKSEAIELPEKSSFSCKGAPKKLW